MLFRYLHIFCVEMFRFVFGMSVFRQDGELVQPLGGLGLNTE